MSSEPSERDGRRGTRNAMAIIGVISAWVYVFNVVIKGQHPVRALFEIVDTLSEDVLMGSLVTVVVGLLIVAVFTFTKLYTQLISNVASFRILEDIVYEDVLAGSAGRGLYRLLHFEAEAEPDTVHPLRPTSSMVAFAVIYAMSWVYVVLFSEALFFVSWSAGVDLPVTAENLQLLPTLALAIPFSARVMAYLRYPYVQDFADIMPAALFVLVLVASLGYLFDSHDQKFFLSQIWEDPIFFRSFVRNGLLLAFLPVFTEGLFWIGTLITTGRMYSSDEE